MAVLGRLKEPLDRFHRIRADKHGWLYIIQNYPVRGIVQTGNGTPKRFKDLYEARSIATGVVCTFRSECMEIVEDGSQLPS